RYSAMPRSVEGLQQAGEWHELRAMLPPLQGRSLLDLGCGFGWHCRYAAEQGAARVVGVDLSENMLRRAAEINGGSGIEYRRAAI
ncbi:class I SAM-dependent methyltransferase, partial [Pseudomonas aeruginosa]